ncbi:MAG: helix-turn-helix transcriptional regulator [Spirochaetaceae bacterium]|nr:helix-turn-helix transcriptional regulator [Spirochaetaceae bacterium]
MRPTAAPAARTHLAALHHQPEERRNLRIGLLIRELRLEKGMTQDQLAREIRTTKSAISRLENHSESITLATLEKVAHALGKVVHIELS